MNTILATILVVVATASTSSADERNTIAAAALHENAIEDAREFCVDYLVADAPKEASALASSTAMVQKANNPKELMERMNTTSAKLRMELGLKGYCALIARRLPTIYRMR